jgi:hypothetical protein
LCPERLGATAMMGMPAQLVGSCIAFVLNEGKACKPFATRKLLGRTVQ